MSTDTLSPSGRPVNNISGVIDAASGPEEPLGKLSGLVHEVFGLLVGVERYCMTSGKLAVFLGLLTGELLTRVVLVILSNVNQNNWNKVCLGFKQTYSYDQYSTQTFQGGRLKEHTICHESI